jgi:hypothetical protein
LRENPAVMYQGFHTEIKWKKHIKDAKGFKIDDVMSGDESEE